MNNNANYYNTIFNTDNNNNQKDNNEDIIIVSTLLWRWLVFAMKTSLMPSLLSLLIKEGELCEPDAVTLYDRLKWFNDP